MFVLETTIIFQHARAVTSAHLSSTSCLQFPGVIVLWKLLTVKRCILVDFSKRIGTRQWFGLLTALLDYCLRSVVNI